MTEDGADREAEAAAFTTIFVAMTVTFAVAASDLHLPYDAATLFTKAGLTEFSVELAHGFATGSAVPTPP